MPAFSRALVVGWFSWEDSDSTAGDFLASEVVCGWLSESGIPFDIALAPPFRGGVSLWDVEPSAYPLVVFVCGPFMPNPWERQFLERFSDSVVCGVNVSLPVPLEQWSPFHLLFERDSSRGSHPDIVFASAEPMVPVIGVCLVEPYAEADVRTANLAIEGLLAGRPMAVVRIDTRLDTNSAGLRSKGEVESLIARMDAVITTRLHGTVLALKHGVPPLVIDPEAGGGRVRRQAEAVGWPVVFDVSGLEPGALEAGLDYCLSRAARERAQACSATGAAGVALVRERFLEAMRRGIPDAGLRE